MVEYTMLKVLNYFQKYAKTIITTKKRLKLWKEHVFDELHDFFKFR
jgi:hypothetical protein